MENEKKFAGEFKFIHSPGYDWGKKKENKEPEEIKEKKEGLLWPTLYFHAVNRPLIPISSYLTIGFVGATSKNQNNQIILKVHSIISNGPPIVTKRLGNMAFLCKLSIIYLVGFHYNQKQN
jgi:hypothetical protein